MKIVILSVGKTHESNVSAGIAEFTDRLKKYYTADWQLISPPKNAASMSEAELKKQEGKMILDSIAKDDCLVLLDERGKNISSPELADLIAQKANLSFKRLVFLIGGAFGVGENVFQRSDFVWSLSKLVFPHMLVRLILAEQLYRAATIIRGEKYHHI